MDYQPSADLEIVADDLDDATHSSMDEAVLADTGSDPNEQRLSLLLRCIVSYCGQLDSKYAMANAAVTLLIDHPELRDKLMKAWEARSFKEIRNLRILRPPIQIASQSGSNESNLSGDAYSRPPTKRLRLQEPHTPRTQSPASQKPSPPRLPRERFTAEMVSALEPFTEYMTKLANGQLDTYLKSIQPERVTDLGVDLPNGPMLLLHSLGDYPDDARLPKLFKSDTVHLFAVSGSGKTRLSLEGLCHEWGLYIICRGGVIGRPTGSDDFNAATLMMESMSNWNEDTNNVDVAHRAFAMLICARIFVLKSLLEKLPSGTDAETARRRWVLAQVMPPFYRSKDIFASVFGSLRAAHKADLIAFIDSMLDSLMDRFGSKFFPGRLFAVIDEAQVAAEYLNESFRSITSGSEKRPVLHPFYNFLWSTKVFKGVILAGTGLSMKMVQTAVTSQYAQRLNYRQVPIVFVEVGRFKKDETLHKTYIGKYLPLSQSVTDQRLMERILYWFHGRYRFTAILIEILLSTQSSSRHRIFSAIVHALTGFTLTDAVDLEKEEPILTADIRAQLTYYAPVAGVRLFEKSNDDLVKYIFHAVMRWRIGSESTSIRINADMHQTIAAGIGHLQEVGPDQTFDTVTNYPVYLCEPLVVLYLSSILSKRLDTTVEAWVADKARLASDNSARGPVLEEAILLVLLDMFGGEERTLADVFDTDQPWGSRKVTLVSLKRGFDGQLQCCPVSLVSGSSDRLGYKAKSPQDVVKFLNNPDGKCFLFPDNHMGPDVTCFLQDVVTKELILLVLQSKLSKKLKSDACLGALESVNPEFFFNVKTNDGDRVNYAPSTNPDLLDQVMTALLPLLGPAEYKPVVEGIRNNLRSSTKLDQKFASQPQRSTPRFLRIIATRDNTRRVSFKADSNGDVGVLRWELVKDRFGDVMWESPPSVA